MSRFLLVALLLWLISPAANAGHPCCFKTYTPATYAAPYHAPAAALPPAASPDFDQAVLNTLYQIGKKKAEADKITAAGNAIYSMTYGTPAASAFGSPSIASPGTAVYATSEYARGYGSADLLQSKSQTLDPHIAANQRNRFVEHVAGLSRDIHGHLTEAANQEHANNLEIEKLRMATAGYEAIIRATAVPEAKKTVTQFAPVETNSQTSSYTQKREVVYGSPAIASSERQAFINATCLNCHSKDNPQGNLILSDYWALSKEQRERCEDLVDSDDPEERMPKARTAGGYGPGKKLTLKQKAYFDAH